VSSSSASGVQHPTGAGVVAIGACTTGVVAPESSGGGSGGSFGGSGGNGQKADSNKTPKAGPAATSFPPVLRAGCPGSAGSLPVPATDSGKPGDGGGAVSVIAAVVHLDGQINASGAAGIAGAASKVGGGGGGSGGMIVIDSPSIMPGTSFALFANGGGGGQGGAGPGGQNAGAGKNGSESTGPATPAAGGNNLSTAGGIGGSGSAGTGSKDGVPGGTGNLPGNAGGGGGGGGAGFIRAHGITTSISPPSTDP